MAQIKKFSLTRLLDGAIAEFHNAFILIVLAYQLNKMSIQKVFPTYQEAVDRLNKAISKNPRLANTQKIAKADAFRDRVINRFFKLIKEMRKSPIPEENAAGTTLWNIASPYEGLTRYEINKQTALTKRLTSDLKTPEAVAAIEVLNLSRLAAQIEQYNNEVEALMAERIDKETEKTKVNTLEQRNEANALYEEVVQLINASALLKSDDSIDELVERANTLIEAYRRVISHQRAGGSGNEKGTRKKENPEIITGETPNP